MNGLPLKFKLYNQGDFVGYEKHEYDGIIEIWHSDDGEEYHCILDNEQWFIIHNEKRQYTGFNDINNEEIYFGDRFANRVTLQPQPGEVKIHNGRIGVFSGNDICFGCEDFKSRLLAENS